MRVLRSGTGEMALTNKRGDKRGQTETFGGKRAEPVSPCYSAYGDIALVPLVRQDYLSTDADFILFLLP